jgi:subtilase family serine protease
MASKDLKGFNFYLHREKDKELIELLEKNGITATVKRGLYVLTQLEVTKVEKLFK